MHTSCHCRLQRNSQAFSLIELLVVIAIILLLSGLVASVFVESKTQARRTESLTVMRQLAIAGNLYAEAWGVHPDSAGLLAESGDIPKDMLFASGLDNYPNGLASQVIEQTYKGESSQPDQWPFPVSYAGWLEWRISKPMYDMWIQSGQGGGWLVDMTSIDVQSQATPILRGEGFYYRLCLDGSMVKRQMMDVPDSHIEGLGSARNPTMLFVDYSQEFGEWLNSRG